MSLPFEPPPPPPPPAGYVPPYRSHVGEGSVGPVIAVLAVIAVLGVIAIVIGRLCTGRTIMGYGHYDLEGWVERKCASCIDGRLEAPRPPPPTPPGPPTSANGDGAGGGSQETAPAEAKHAERRPEGAAES